MRTLTLLVAAAAALVACSSSVVQTDKARDPAVASFAQRYTKALCERRVTCSTLSKYLADACAEAHKFEDLDESVAKGRASFDEASADACVKVISSLSCQQLATLPDTIPNTFEACGNVFQGHVVPGEPCYADEECADGFCGSLDQTCPGVCQANKKPGDACSDQDCGHSNHACVGVETCAAIGRLGDPCDDADARLQCGYGLRCLNNACAPFAKDAKKGESCMESTCASGLSCDGNACTVLGAEGAPCDVYSCAEGLLCKGYWLTDLEDSNAPHSAGTCAKPVDVGGPCVVLDGAVAITGCATGLECLSGTCAMPPTSGKCGPSYGCARGYYCNSVDQCVPQDPDGAECIGGLYDQCAGGGCRGGVCASLCSP